MPASTPTATAGNDSDAATPVRLSSSEGRRVVRELNEARREKEGPDSPRVTAKQLRAMATGGTIDLQYESKHYAVDTANYRRFDKAIRYMFSEMTSHARGPDVAIMRYWNDRGLVTPALVRFYSLVQTDGEWDHKRADKLPARLDLPGPPPDYQFPVRGLEHKEVYYDIWSNMHYGYVGAASGINEHVLIGAQMIPSPRTGRYDPADSVMVHVGIDLWKTKGLGMTLQDLHAAILGGLQQIQGLMDKGVDVDTIRTPRNNE